MFNNKNWLDKKYRSKNKNLVWILLIFWSVLFIKSMFGIIGSHFLQSYRYRQNKRFHEFLFSVPGFLLSFLPSKWPNLGRQWINMFCCVSSQHWIPLYNLINFFLFQQTGFEDVSNFDEEFPSEKPVLPPPKDVRALTNDEQTLFQNFTYMADWC